jgi:hypothetical protein
VRWHTSFKHAQEHAYSLLTTDHRRAEIWRYSMENPTQQMVCELLNGQGVLFERCPVYRAWWTSAGPRGKRVPLP